MRRHHHLLLGVTARCVRSFPLVYEVEQMSLVVSCRGVCSSDPLISNSTCIGCEAAASISVTLLILILIAISILASIALSQLGHEVAVEHGLSHLCLLLGLGQFVPILRS